MVWILLFAQALLLDNGVCSDCPRTVIVVVVLVVVRVFLGGRGQGRVVVGRVCRPARVGEEEQFFLVFLLLLSCRRRRLFFLLPVIFNAGDV